MDNLYNKIIQMFESIFLSSLWKKNTFACISIVLGSLSFSYEWYVLLSLQLYLQMSLKSSQKKLKNEHIDTDTHHCMGKSAFFVGLWKSWYFKDLNTANVLVMQPSNVKCKCFMVWPSRRRLRERYCPLVEAVELSFRGSEDRSLISKGGRTLKVGLNTGVSL